MKIKTQHTLGILAALTLLLFGITGCQGLKSKPVIVKLEPANTTINAGQLVEVLVNVEDVKDLFGVELTITFSPQVLEVMDADLGKPDIQITSGDFLGRGMVDVNRATNGTIEYTLTQVPPERPVSGSGTLARILFKGNTAGTTAITLATVTLYDENDNTIASTAQNSSITVEAVNMPAAVQPEPTPIPPTPTPLPPQPTPVPLPTLAPDASLNCGRILGYHIVQRGETLYAIGRVYATRPDAIAACNNLRQPATIHAGNHLAIPYAPWSPIPPGPVAERQFTPNLNP